MTVCSEDRATAVARLKLIDATSCPGETSR